MVGQILSKQERAIDVTFTRRGTWYITAPCGWHAELPGECDRMDIRALCVHHRRRCCRSARIYVETDRGYREIRKGEVA
jgi:hypothetical protein